VRLAVLSLLKISVHHPLPTFPCVGRVSDIAAPLLPRTRT
jgi:hypothetical protein